MTSLSLKNFFKIKFHPHSPSTQTLIIKIIFSPLPAKAEGDYSFRFRPSVRPSHSNFKLCGLFVYVHWYIDLIFGMWLYLDELQFKFEFRFGQMIFGWVMALELVFFVQILSSPDFFLRPLIYWLDIWYVAISRWVTF